MNKRYNYIFFDLDNTLWDFKINSYEAMQVVFKYIDIREDVTFDTFFMSYSRHNHLLWDNYRKKGITKRELTRKRFQNTFEELGITGVDAEQMNKDYLREMPKQQKLLDGAIEILNYLKNKNYQLFIITNGFKEVQEKKLISSGIDGFFNKIYISEDVKSPKPSNEIFEYAIKSSNAKKTQSLMVGDDWETDVMGALKFGIDSAYLGKESNGNKAIQTAHNVHYISSLCDLMKIL